MNSKVFADLLKKTASIRPIKFLLLPFLFIGVITPLATGQNLPPYVPKDGLVGWWPFNGNANDESGNGNDGVVNGATLSEDRFGTTNRSYFLNGQTDYISVPDGNMMLPSNISLSSWVKIPSNYTGNNNVGRIIRSRFFGYTLTFVLSNNSINFEIWTNSAGSTTLTTSNVLTNDDVWHHVVGTFDGNEIKMYFDGLLIGSLQTPNSNILYSSDGLVMFGRDGNNGSPLTALYQGWIDDIAIYNRALTQEEITALYTGEPVNPPTACNPLPSNLQNGLVGYWPFCGNANDESGNGNDGAIKGATLTTDRLGNINSAFNFNGIDNYIETNLSKINTTTFTMSCWYKTSTVPKGETGLVFSRNGLYSGNGLLLYHNGFSQNLYLDRSKCYLSSNLQIGYPELSDNTWHNFLGIVTDTLMTIYIDGKKIAQKIEKEPFCYDGKTIFGTDLAYPNRFFTGDLDDITIWNRALTVDEVEQLYNNSKPYSCDIDSLLNTDINYGSVTDIDGNTYPTVKIGNQEWMADNLRTSRYQNGNPIPNVTDNNEWIKLKTGAWSYYNNDSTYNCPYGKLYNWYAASHPDNVCPSGWRLPKYSELEILTDLELGGVGVAGGKMKSQKLWKNPNAGATNNSGFSGLPGGYRSNVDGGGYFYGLETQGWWYFNSNNNPVPRNLYFDNELVNPTVLFGFYNHFNRETGVSIRCIKESNPCELIGEIQPVNPEINTGDTIVFNAALIVSNGTSYTWQANTAGTGWSEIISPSPKYSGQNTSQLTLNGASLSNHLQEFRLIANNGNCADTSNVSTIFIKDTCLVTIYDTVFTMITDTSFIAVTDTLIINVLFSSTSTPSNNVIRVFPNPTLSQLIIDAGQYNLMDGYTITITNSLGATVWTEPISEPLYTLDLSGWSGKGIYYLTLTDPQGKIVTTRKIVLQ